MAWASAAYLPVIAPASHPLLPQHGGISFKGHTLQLGVLPLSATTNSNAFIVRPGFHVPCICHFHVKRETPSPPSFPAPITTLKPRFVSRLRCLLWHSVHYARSLSPSHVIPDMQGKTVGLLRRPSRRRVDGGGECGRRRANQPGVFWRGMGAGRRCYSGARLHWGTAPLAAARHAFPKQHTAAK